MDRRGELRVLYVVHRFPQLTETFILREINELIRQGHAVEIWSLERPPPGSPDGPDVSEAVARTRYLPPRRHIGPSAIRAMIDALRTRPARTLSLFAFCLRWALEELDHRPLGSFAYGCWLWKHTDGTRAHVHAHFASAPATVALVLAGLAPRPFSFTGHGHDVFVATSPCFLRAKAARARFVVFASEIVRARIGEGLREADRAKTVVIRNGLDLDYMSPEVGDQVSPPAVLCVGRLIEKKGQESLLRACAILKERGVEFNCEIIGEGPLRRRLEEHMLALGLADRVDLLGTRFQPEVQAAFRRASVFVLPCTRSAEGDEDILPVAILEALAFGVPVVTTRIGGIPEVVHDGVSGLLVPSRDPVALANTLERVLSDAGLRSSLAGGGRQALDDYRLDSNVAQLWRLFRDGPHGDGVGNESAPDLVAPSAASRAS